MPSSSWGSHVGTYVCCIARHRCKLQGIAFFAFFRREFTHLLEVSAQSIPQTFALAFPQSFPQSFLQSFPQLFPHFAQSPTPLMELLLILILDLIQFLFPQFCQATPLPSLVHLFPPRQWFWLMIEHFPSLFEVSSHLQFPPDSQSQYQSESIGCNLELVPSQILSLLV